MSKSRSGDDKEKEKEKEREKDREKEREKDNQNEDGDAAEENEEENIQESSANHLQLNSETSTELNSPSADANSLMVRNDSAIPSSPPPSYEHVLEETRQEHAAEVQKQETPEVTEKRQQITWTEKNTAGGGPKGDRKTPTKGPEILHKSSKEFYRAMAKQWGITCKMSDHCRCLDCQSHYFDCEYENNEHQKTDGGLGAGTPMFISEVMHGTACVLL